MKQINRFLIMLTLLCILGLAGSGIAAADSVLKLHANNGSGVVTDYAFPAGLSSMVGTISHIPIAPDASSMFGGWYTLENLALDPSGVYVPAGPAAPTGDLISHDEEYYAVWVPTSSTTVKLHANNGTSLFINHPFTHGSDISSIVYIPDYPGAEAFAGWYKLEDLVSDPYGLGILVPSASAAPASGTLANGAEYYAVWEIHTAKFYQNDGSALSTEISFFPVSSSTIESISPTHFTAPSGSVFQGWYKSEDLELGSFGLYLNTPYIPTESGTAASGLVLDDDVYFAVWGYEIRYSITTHTGTAASPSSAIYYLAQDPEVFATTRLPGAGHIDLGDWDLEGWYDSSFTYEWGESSFPMTHDGITTVHAKVSSYVRLDSNGGFFYGGPASTTFDIPITIDTTISDFMDDLAAVPLPLSLDGWTADGKWYSIVSASGVVDTTSAFTSSDSVPAPKSTLHIGWFGDINLNANGGNIPGSSTFTVQPGQAYSDIGSALYISVDVSNISHIDGWDARVWYKDEASGIVDEADRLLSTDIFNVGDTLYVGWFGNINLDENGGNIPGSLSFTVQPGETYFDIESALYISADVSNMSHTDGWNARVWYKDEASGIVDEAERLLSTDTFNVGDTLYAGWFGDITLNANGGSFASVSDPYDYEVQAGQTYADIESDLLAELGLIAHNDGWTDGLWYTAADASGIVAESDLLVETNPLIKDSDFFVGWFGEITLDANDGEFGSGSGVDIARIKIQAGQTYDDLRSLITISQTPLPENGAWSPVIFYKAVSSGIVNPSDFLDMNDPGVLSTPMPVSETLYVGWFNDVFLDANGGEFGSGSSVFRIPVEIQFGQTYGDLVPLIAAELAGNAPEYGRLNPKMWYLTQISGNAPYVDASSFLDLTNPATLSILADGGEIFFVGWFHPSSGGSGTGGATIVGNNTTQIRENQTEPVQEPEISSGSNGSSSSDDSENSVDSPPFPEETRSEPVKKSYTWLYIILALILILVLCGGYYYFKVMKK
jgi:hypothetical protein